MKKFIAFNFILLLHVVCCAGQDIFFRTLTTENGLSHNSITSLYKDAKGFIWIGTREGLNLFNGNTIRKFKSAEMDSGKLNGSVIKRIAGDGKDKVYILNNNGVAEYDSRTDHFKPLFKGLFQQIIFHQEKLYILEKNFIHEYDGKNNHKKLFYTFPDKTATINTIQIDRTNQVWIGTGKGLYILSQTQHSLKKIIDSIEVVNIFEDTAGELWISSWNNGLYRIDKNKLINYTHQDADPFSISTNFTRYTLEDDKGIIWIGTFRGLNKFDKRTGRFQHYTEKQGMGGLSNASIWSLIKDHQGTIWIGTYFGGVNFFNPDYEIYSYYQKTDVAQNGLSSPVVGKMTADHAGNLWICTEGGGLNRYNPVTRQFKWFKHHNKDPHSISQDNLKSIYYDSARNVLWIGTHLGGLNKLDLKTYRFSHYFANSQDSNALPSNIIRDIYPYQDKLILATPQGIAVFDPQTGKCKKLFEADGYNVIIDQDGTLWTAQLGAGLTAYRFDTRKLKYYVHDPHHPHSIGAAAVTRIIKDRHNNLWLGTSPGVLSKYRKASDDFSNFDLSLYDITCNSIYDVCESPSGKLLVATNQSFAVFDPLNNTFQNYSVDRGFPMRAMNENALFLDKNGKIFLGGLNGMIAFYEKDLQNQTKAYDIIPYKLIVNNDEIKAGDSTGILDCNLAYTGAITLKSEHAVFSIEVATNNFIPFNKDEIIYRLAGFSDKWTSMHGQNLITYTNLSPGDYTLLIKTNKPGGPEARLAIKILPPFYKTIYAYILYFLLITAAFYYIIKAYKARIKLESALKYEQLHIQDVEKLNQSKLHFFTNISHEFRTPLTLIIGQVEQLLKLKKTLAADTYKKIAGIHKYSLQLQELITELLDFRKQEAGYLHIKVSQHNIADFLARNYELFKSFAASRKVAFLFNCDLQELLVWYDTRQMQKVINNLLSNAFKHTDAGHTVSISVTQENSMAVIKVADTGNGIAPEDLERIFDLFYQTGIPGRETTGTGIGLSLVKGIVELHHGTITIESKVNAGTVCTVQIPLGKAHFKSADIYVSDVSEVAPLPDIAALESAQVLMTEAPEATFNGRKMLIVEDNEALRKMLENIFDSVYEVITAADGLAGLDIARAELPDIVVSDVLMPKMSGTELCQKLKMDHTTCHIPVVLLTARASVEQSLEGLLIGADDYIPKPFNTQVLVARCNNLVNNRIVLQEKFSKQPQTSTQILATNKLDKEFLDTATQIIENNLANPDFNVYAFSREMGIARTNLFAKIKAVTGQTPNEFISTIRLKKGAWLLQTAPEMNIAEIAELIGFNTSQYFSKCFKDVYQLSPIAYRKSFFDTAGEKESSDAG